MSPIDTTTPTVSSVTTSGTGITAGSGDLDAGKTVKFTVTMSEAVTVNTTGGTPTLTLNDGGIATYTGGSGTSALTFSYTVAAGQNTSDLTVTAYNANGGTITDGAGNVATMTGAVTNPAGTLQIDTTPPPAPVIATDLVNRNNSVTLTGTAEAGSTVTVYYDGRTLLGTTTTSATGAWSYTTGTLSNGVAVFTATATDTAGNTSAASTALDPVIGVAGQPVTLIQTDGSTSLAQVGNDYYLFAAGTTSGVELNNGSAPVTVGLVGAGAWSPIGAVATPTGYDVAWDNSVTGNYQVWALNSSGVFTGILLSAGSGALGRVSRLSKLS